MNLERKLETAKRLELVNARGLPRFIYRLFPKGKTKDIVLQAVREINAIDQRFTERDCGEMVEFIDGPYNRASDLDVDSGMFDKEYGDAYNLLKGRLESHGITIEGEDAVLLGEVDGSRFFPFYLGDNLDRLRPLMQGVSRALAELNCLNLRYGAGIALGWNIGGDVVRIYIGISVDDRCYCVIHE